MIQKRANRKGGVLVIGGAGFIGSHLVDALVLDGFEVSVLDALVPSVHTGRLPSWFNPKAKFIRGDVRTKKVLAQALRGVNTVFHLAAYMDNHADFSTYIQTNVMSVALLFEVIRENRYPIKKVIMSSSQSVYGEGRYRCPTHGLFYPSARTDAHLRAGQWDIRCPKGDGGAVPLKEQEDDELHPLNAYGLSKGEAEHTLFHFGRELGIPTVALRYSIVHGSRQSLRNFYSGALRQFSSMARGGLPITMHEDGKQTRDFIHISDVIEAHMTVVRDSRADGEVYNVGTGVETRVFDLAKAVADGLGVPFLYELPGLYRMNTARYSVADIRKLRKLGWKPHKTLSDNVEDYLSWIHTFPDAGKALRAQLQELEKTNVVRKTKRV